MIFQNAFSDSTVDGHLGLFPFGPVPNRAATNIFLVDIRILGHVPGVGHGRHICLTFVDITTHFPKVIVQIFTHSPGV